MTPEKQTFYSDLQGAEIVPNHQVQERLANMASGNSPQFRDDRILNGLGKIEKAVKTTNRSKQIDNVVYTQRGNRMIKKHQSFLKSMGK